VINSQHGMNWRVVGGGGVWGWGGTRMMGTLMCN